MDDTPRDPLADSPLFREIQRVLLSSSGPVNWELARQVGIAVAASVPEEQQPTEADREGFVQAVRVAELAVADLTGLPTPTEVTRVQVARRAGWVEANATGLREIFEPSAAGLARALDEARGEQAPELPEAMAPLQGLLGQMTPLLMGAQVGTVLGTVAQHAHGQYELPFPRSGEPALLFVLPNIATFEREWSLPSLDFRAWVALHEVTHAFTVGRPWVPAHVHAMLRELAQGIRFDLSGLEARIAGLDLSDPEKLTEALGDPSELFGGELTDEQRLLMRRMQAFLAAAEGYADHVMHAVGRTWVSSYAQIDEAMRRRHEDRAREERMIEQLLGIDVTAEHYHLGRAFCDRVAAETDEPTLARMWGSAESLPSIPELEEPTLWLARSL